MACYNDWSLLDPELLLGTPCCGQPLFLATLQWGELSKRPQAGAGGMPDLALQLRVSKNALRSPAFQEEIVSQVWCRSFACNY